MFLKTGFEALTGESRTGEATKAPIEIFASVEKSPPTCTQHRVHFDGALPDRR